MGKKVIIIIFLSLIIYNIVPVLNLIIPQISAYTFLLDLWLINTLYSLIASTIFCRKYGFKLWVSVIISILFVPTMFIFYNFSAYVYSIVYVIFSLIGCIIGGSIRHIIIKK